MSKRASRGTYYSYTADGVTTGIPLALVDDNDLEREIYKIENQWEHLCELPELYAVLYDNLVQEREARVARRMPVAAASPKTAPRKIRAERNAAWEEITTTTFGRQS